jgi:DNA-binding GntR family transcriptional regulator
MKLNRHHSLFKQGRLAESLAEHRAMMQAVGKRDAAGAARLMRAHFDNGLEAAVPAEANVRVHDPHAQPAIPARQR